MFNFILPRFLFKIEKWKWNKEYRVYVSNMGHFKNEYKQDLPIKIDNKGYCKINTINCGWISVHRLVMLTWKPIPNAENLTIDHLDHNKRNNSVENLEWVTLEENQIRAKADLVKCGSTDKKLPVAVKVTPSGQPRYKAGKKLIFNTLDEAAAWCIQQSGAAQLTPEQAKAKILIKCKSGAKYCGRTWKEIN
jgi:hypothetical protein